MTAPTPTPPSFTNAKAEAKAAKAHAKALRPWYRKKRWILSIGFVLLIIIAAAAGSSGTSTSGDGGSNSAEKSESGGGGGSGDDGTSGGVGDDLTNAGTTYKVTSARTTDTIGDPEFGGAKADGVFVIVNLELTNNKDDTKTFNESAAKIVTTDGNEYETTNDAVLAFGDESLFLKEIQPDLTTSGKLAFDIPSSKTSGAKLVIEDLWGSGEVTVDLEL